MRTVARRIDWPLLLSALTILMIGTLLVWSSTAANEQLAGDDPTSFVRRHVMNVAIGLTLGALVFLTDRRWVRILAPVVYGGSILGLLAVLVAGATINGSRSWLLIGGMSIQPAEFAKLAVISGMALVVAERTEAMPNPRIGRAEVAAMLAIAALPAALILGQPDLGTMLVLTATVFGVLAISGVPPRWLAALAGAGVAAAVVVVSTGLLKAYQVDRFLAFTDPALDPRGAGYNTTQARIAIGNGGLFGQGLFDGSQTKAGFVPEQHTDFIFTVAGEELGLLGAGLLIALYGVLLWRALQIAIKAPDLFGRVAAAGITCWLGFQTFQNVGMCLGIMPVTGVPLPLVSYGGSSMFASLAAIGLLLNIGASVKAAGPAAVGREWAARRPATLSR